MFMPGNSLYVLMSCTVSYVLVCNTVCASVLFVLMSCMDCVLSVLQDAVKGLREKGFLSP